MADINKIAVLLPTRFRPLIFKRMLESWKSNSVCSDLIAGLQKDDDCLEQYKEILAKEPTIKVVMIDNIGLAKKYNALYDQFPDYAAYALLNDDHIFRTPNWDSLIMARLQSLKKRDGHGLHIIYWKDGWMDDIMPSGFCTRELLEIIKKPCFDDYISHVFIDNMYQMMIGFGSIGHYMPEIFIEHMHQHLNKAEADKNYSEHLKPLDSDYEGFVRWMKGKCEEVVTEIIKRKNHVNNKLSFS